MTEPRELLQAWLDGELTEAEKRQVDVALAADPALREGLAKLKAAGQLVKASATPPAPEELTTMIRDRIAEAQRPWHERLFPRRVPYLTLGAASTVVLCILLAPLTSMPELGGRTRDVYVTVNDSMTAEADGVVASPASAGRAAGLAEEPPPDVATAEATPSSSFHAMPGKTSLRALPTPMEREGEKRGLVDDLSTRNAREREMEAEISELKTKAESLTSDTTHLSRREHIEEEARALGLQPVPETSYSEELKPVPFDVEPLPRLQAGEIDDNLLFGKYVGYAERQARLRDQGVSFFPVRERQVIQVVDEHGVGIPDARISVRGPEAMGPRFRELRTDASGQAVFFPGRYGSVTSWYVAASDPRAIDVRYVPTRFDSGDGQGPWRLEIGSPYPPARAGQTVDIAFVVDTTGSMGEEIRRLRETIDQVTKLLDKSAQRPKLRFGMVLFRDQGDQYVTKEFAFTEDVAAFRKSLANVAADGGGDNAEHVQAGLHAAVDKLQWSPAPAVRLAFLIGDAPPHLDYQAGDDNPPYLQSVDEAREKGIKFFTISTSGNDDVGEYVWRQIALLTRGKFLFITKGDALGDVPDRTPQPDDGTTPHHVERQDYTVQALPNLIEQCVRRELASLGTKPPTTIDVDLPAEPQVTPAPQPTAPLVEFKAKQLSFAAYLLILMANLSGWLWAWRKSRRASLRRG